MICHGQIRLTGRKGSIIGGKVQAIRGLIATSLGNDAEKRTEIFVGAGIDVYSRLRVMEKKIETTREELAKIEEVRDSLQGAWRQLHERSAPDVAASD